MKLKALTPEFPRYISTHSNHSARTLDKWKVTNTIFKKTSNIVLVEIATLSTEALLRMFILKQTLYFTFVSHCKILISHKYHPVYSRAYTRYSVFSKLPIGCLHDLSTTKKMGVKMRVKEWKWDTDIGKDHFKSCLCQHKNNKENQYKKCWQEISIGFTAMFVCSATCRPTIAVTHGKVL